MFGCAAPERALRLGTISALSRFNAVAFPPRRDEVLPNLDPLPAGVGLRASFCIRREPTILAVVFIGRSCHVPWGDAIEDAHPLSREPVTRARVAGFC